MADRPHHEILIATGNPSKAREIIAVLSHHEPGSPRVPVHWRRLDELPELIPEPAEDADSFEANAALKARYYSRWAGLWTLADDSGLEVDALGGVPGVRSARYAELPERAPRTERDAANNRKLVEALRGIPPERRTARFRCALALADGDRILITAEGVIEGRIIDQPRGRNGFGYDPHFIVPELDKTTAELEPEYKNRISHRGRALLALRERLRTLLAECNS